MMEALEFLVLDISQVHISHGHVGPIWHGSRVEGIRWRHGPCRRRARHMVHASFLPHIFKITSASFVVLGLDGLFHGCIIVVKESLVGLSMFGLGVEWSINRRRWK